MKFIYGLNMNFVKRFTDLNRIKSDTRMFLNPFNCDINDVPLN